MFSIRKYIKSVDISSIGSSICIYINIPVTTCMWRVRTCKIFLFSFSVCHLAVAFILRAVYRNDNGRTTLVGKKKKSSGERNWGFPRTCAHITRRIKAREFDRDQRSRWCGVDVVWYWYIYMVGLCTVWLASFLQSYIHAYIHTYMDVYTYIFLYNRLCFHLNARSWRAVGLPCLLLIFLQCSERDCQGNVDKN